MPMTRVTPALDHLTQTARADFLRNISHPEMTGPGLPHGFTMNKMLTSKKAAAADVYTYLQISSLATIAIPRLSNLRRRLYESDEQLLERATADPALHGVSKEISANLGSLARDVEDYLIGLLCDTITNLPDPQVSATLLELWRVREEEFDPDAPGSDLNLNADDVPSTNFDHPQHQMLDLIIDTITARLLKRHGPELLLAWADAVEEAHRQHT
jgi:hypothetical protein